MKVLKWLATVITVTTFVCLYTFVTIYQIATTINEFGLVLYVPFPAYRSIERQIQLSSHLILVNGLAWLTIVLVWYFYTIYRTGLFQLSFSSFNETLSSKPMRAMWLLMFFSLAYGLRSLLKI